MPAMPSGGRRFFYSLGRLFGGAEPPTGTGAFGRERSRSDAVRANSIFGPLHRQGADLVASRIEMVRAAAGQHHLSAQFGKPQREAAAKPGAPSRDYRHAPLKYTVSKHV